MSFPRVLNWMPATLLSICAGVALYCAAPPLNWWPLAFLGVACLWLVSSGGLFTRFCLGTLAGFVYFYLLCDWAALAARTELARLALALSQGVFFGVLLIAWTYSHRGYKDFLARKPLAGIFLVATTDSVLWVLVEQCRGMVPFGGMPWGSLGYSLVDSPLVNLSPWGSIQLVDFVAVFCAVLAANVICALRARAVFSAITALTVPLVVLILPSFIGNAVPGSASVRIGVVQGNVPDESKLGPGESRALIVTQHHAQATRKILSQRPDIILWPESASDRDIRQDPEAKNIVDTLMKDSGGVPIMLGTQKYVGDTRTNDYVAINGDGVVGTYSKQHPVPFGEYLPFRTTIERIVPEAKKISVDMVPGNSAAQLKVRAGKTDIVAAVPICFEVAYSRIVAQGALGANLLVVPTNNASFGRSGEPLQQLAMTRFRAIEHGKSAIQVSTSGTSAVISARGVVRYQTDLFEQSATVIDVPLISTQTVATRTAELLEYLCFALGVLCLLMPTYLLLRQAKLSRSTQSQPKSKRKS
ncbi:apolipoprotein N-acyltransferase [Arcanobacterium bovis]|uniref:Apolipoprotein N-acyltransferase n=1 Tax=Arcanobacterium bovis TaxID=2529275 RepID=A0A4Q9V1L0_9ACTO|nr:apolipoprotein N-acyltransferase [Arcanobacterium bovis]TBW22933.1 apolipoprotein N-acyltransferase [Arcanobacterium bovis]